MRAQYALINKEFIKSETVRFSLKQAERFQCRHRFTIPIVRTKLYLVSDILTSVKSYLHAFGISDVDYLNEDFLNSTISQLMSQNRFFKDGFAELMVHPDLNNPNLYSSSIFLNETVNFTSEKEGQYCIPMKCIDSSLEGGPTAHVNGSLFEKKLNKEAAQNICFFNTKGHVSHSLYGSILVIKGTTCYYPNKNNAKINAPVTNSILDILKDAGINPHPMNISEQTIFEADELLFPNNESIIEWCKGYKHKRYFSRKFKIITNEIRQILK